ncbi:hypothetical protein GZH53_06035 [Flavihumibacter sp. R14]|nr:hypothetical protein [Flavihumibacter soli]
MCKFKDTPIAPIRVALVSVMLLLVSFTSLAQLKPSELIGKIYRDIKEIKEFKNYYGDHSRLIPTADFGTSDKYAVVQITDTVEKNHIIILEELLNDETSPGRSKYKILDLLYVKYKSAENWISLCECYQGSTYTPELIALVATQPNEDFTTKIKKVWRLDFKMGRILPLTNKVGIKCSNPDEGCTDE